MERAGKTIAKLRNMPGIEAPELAFAAWTAAMGERLASRAMASALVRDKLIIDVEDKVWQQQLYQLRGPIMAKLTALLGSGVVNELEFRVRGPKAEVPRRPPRRATSVQSDAD
ncbi:MAG: DciA family protein, partial [Bryobacteraceae bacterium]